MNEHVEPGTSARPTTRGRSSNLAVRARAGDVWQVQLGARPFLPVEDLGIGLIAFAPSCF